MSAISLRLPDSLHSRARLLSRRDHVSINQFVATAVAEKISAEFKKVEAAEIKASEDKEEYTRVIRELDGRIEILSGLSGGEQVVVPSQPEGTPRP